MGVPKALSIRKFLVRIVVCSTLSLLHSMESDYLIARSDTPISQWGQSPSRTSQASSSHQNPSVTTRSRNQTARVAPPSYNSDSSGKHERPTSECCSQHPVDPVGTLQPRVWRQDATSTLSSTRNGSSSNDPNHSGRPKPDLQAIKKFLESCSRGLGDLAPLFLDYGFNSQEHLI